MQTAGFQRRIEDFACEHCGKVVLGDGYTNHCPHCLWSKHVDVNPGDRAEKCEGLMAPVRLEGGFDNCVIIHRCGKCGMERRNKVAASDSREALAAVAEAASRE